MKVREMNIEFYSHYMNALEHKQGPQWQYDETKPCGVDYNSFWQARIYDRCHQKFRDYAAESARIIESLKPETSHTVMDMGCGTGAFALNAARYFKKVYAVDISDSMLRRARKKARKANLKNVEFCNGGFLTYIHNDEPVDAVVTGAALHHLPDFWKLIALKNIASTLRTNGKLYLADVVFSFDLNHHKSSIKAFIQKTVNRIGPEMMCELNTHLSKEYSTFSWIMEGLLEKAGFVIENANYTNGFFATYLCTKKGE